jgi:hypothetical protein
MAITHYTRSIDGGYGRQNIQVNSAGIIISQEVVAQEGEYKGDGNPEIVGTPKRLLRGFGFRKVAGPQRFIEGRWISLDPLQVLQQEIMENYAPGVDESHEPDMED